MQLLVLVRHGSTLARLLDQKYKVLAINKKNDTYQKCCGGLLSPDAQKILAKFDLCLPNHVLVNPQIFSVRTIDIPNQIEKFYQRFYLNMDRSKFDNFLMSLIPNHIDIFGDSTCKKIQKNHDSYSIEFENNGKRIIKEAKIVIGSDGANSIVRNTFYQKHKIKKYVAIQEWYQNMNTSSFYSCIFDKKITDSYSWTISKDDYFIIGGAFPIQDSNTRFDLLKETARKKGFLFEEKVKREGCFVYLNQGFKSICTGKNNAYLIGEAAGMISPSSLEGISYAMESGSILAGLLNKNIDHLACRYFLKTLKIRFRLSFKCFKKPFMYYKFFRNLVIRSGIGAIKK